MSNRTRIIPGSTRKPFKYSIDLDLNEIRTLAVSHVIVRIPDQTVYRYDDDDDNEDDDDDDNQIIQVDAYTRAARYKRISNGKAWSSDQGNLRYYVALDGITDAVSVEFKNSNCTEKSYFHYSMIELSEPWVSGSGQMQFIGEK